MTDEAHYHDQFDALHAQRPDGMPAHSLVDLKKAVRDQIRADNDPETGEIDGCHILNFKDFKAFLAWWLIENSMDSQPEDHVKCFTGLLTVVYDLLVMEAKEEALFKGICVHTPASTLVLLERLRVMQPDTWWGTQHIRGFKEWAGVQAPDYIIVCSDEFGPRKHLTPDPFTDICGYACDPSTWGLSAEAAQLMRDHNQIFLEIKRSD
jgi:hypothetical protein